ncbi:MAG: hypothetical protein IAE94_13320 [Chthoniobacterales bacterium]|nr:hypothetical protein [Chthoniobacterales bacterium]
MPFQPRIWRSSRSNFLADEVLHSPVNYTREALRDIRTEGFDGIWLRGCLYDLMDSRVLPELNRPHASERRKCLRELIERGREEGVGVWLFFNEPMAIPADHLLWHKYPDLRGTPHWEYRRKGDGDFLSLGDVHALEKEEMISICVSSLRGKEFFTDAIEGLLTELSGLAGVILVTASESHSHCWSHHTCLPTGDPFRPLNEQELSCPHCRKRGPAAIVLDLLTIWKNAASRMPKPCRILASNWSWSMWYPDPQHEIVGHLPEGIEFLANCERGGTSFWQNRKIPIEEYSFSYCGPSELFCRAKQVAGTRPVHALFLVNTTHEIASVPNLPLIPNLFQKWSGLQREGTTGAMACWNFACDATLNTHAFKQFNEQIWTEESAFIQSVATSYFGNTDIDAISIAWHGFCAALQHFPFNFGVLYFGLANYAPAYPLDLTYHAHPMGLSHLYQNQWGDRIEDTLLEWPLDEVTEAWGLMAKKWHQALVPYRNALQPQTPNPIHQRHRHEELNCAEMIGCHWLSTYHAYRFHAWRLATMKRQGLTAPCTLEADDEARSIWREEERNARLALLLMESDSRLGYHGEAHTHLFTPDTLREKLRKLSASLNT